MLFDDATKIATVKINGETVDLESVSGKINASNLEHKGNFSTPDENYYSASNGRLYDSE